MVGIKENSFTKSDGPSARFKEIPLEEFIQGLDKDNPAFSYLVDALHSRNSFHDLVSVFQKPGTADGMQSLTQHLARRKLYPVFDRKFNKVFACSGGGHTYLLPYLFMYHKKELQESTAKSFFAYIEERLGFFVSSMGELEYNKLLESRYTSAEQDFFSIRAR